MTTTSSDQVRTDHRLSMDELAAVIARDIPAGAFVNLGIGQPTRIADHLPADSGVVLHTENGMLNMGLKSEGDAIDPERLSHTRAVLRNCGNMSSTTVFFVLDAFLKVGQPGPGEYGLLAVLGPGFSCELALIRG